jgi:hypothetical protein
MLGVINYESKWAPRYFPLQFKYRNGGGTIHNWRFTKVVINDEQVVNENSFRDEEQPLKEGWKLTQSKSPTLWEWWFLGKTR